MEIELELGKSLEQAGDFCLFEIAEKKIVVIHNIEILDDQIFDEVDIIIHGHTHRLEKSILANKTILNAGECSAKKYGKSTVMIYDFDKSDVIIKTLSL